MNDFDLKLLYLGLFWVTPVALLLQLGAFLLLLWCVGLRWRPDALGTRAFGRWLAVAGIYVAPILMLLLSTGFEGGYQGERGGHWFYHTHSGLAGLMLVPVFAAGSIRAAVALANRTYTTSGLDFVILVTLIAICGWYAYATAFLGMADDLSGDMSMTAVVPALAAINYGLVAVDIWRHDRLQAVSVAGLYVWFSALAVSLLARVPFAKRFYDALPTESPRGYGDCFVVSAAAMGHPRFVGSSADPQSGRRVNGQLLRLWALEQRLASSRPVAHRCLRRCYDIVGPVMARRIRSPYVADAVYVALKPLEWLALWLLRR